MEDLERRLPMSSLSRLRCLVLLSLDLPIVFSAKGFENLLFNNSHTHTSLARRNFIYRCYNSQTAHPAAVKRDASARDWIHYAPQTRCGCIVTARCASVSPFITFDILHSNKFWFDNMIIHARARLRSGGGSHAVRAHGKLCTHVLTRDIDGDEQ